MFDVSSTICTEPILYDANNCSKYKNKYLTKIIVQCRYLMINNIKCVSSDSPQQLICKKNKLSFQLNSIQMTINYMMERMKTRSSESK